MGSNPTRRTEEEVAAKRRSLESTRSHAKGSTTVRSRGEPVSRGRRSRLACGEDSSLGASGPTVHEPEPWFGLTPRIQARCRNLNIPTFGMYLGDGCISLTRMAATGYESSLDKRYPGIDQRGAAAAMRAVVPRNTVHIQARRAGGCSRCKRHCSRCMAVPLSAARPRSQASAARSSSPNGRARSSKHIPKRSCGL